MPKHSNHFYNKQLQPFSQDLRHHMTKSEACLWKYVLRDGGLLGYSFRRQRPMGRFIADFVCFELKLVIEVDGITHDFETVQRKDAQKDDFLTKAGFSVLRFSDWEVLNQIETVQEILEEWVRHQELKSKGSP